MTEILLSQAILFNTGYVLQTSNSLLLNTLYYLRIQENNNIYNRTYTPMYNNNIILDTWGTIIIQQGTNVCFTLTDTLPCETPICNLEITQQQET